MPGTRVEDLRVAFGGTRALDGVTCRFEPGVTALLGPNGAGKTTLLRCLATALAPSSGTIEYDGEDAGDLRAIRRRLGYLPQNPGAYPTFTVRRFVEYVAALKEIPRAQIRAEADRVLVQVELQDRSRARVKSLSGGMKQRLALACALLGSPELLVLDEPTVGLDPEQRIRFREIVARQGREAAVVLSTHLTEEVATVCRWVVVIDRGTVVFDGRPDDLAERARGKAWITTTPAPDAYATWEVAGSRVRQIGATPPPEGELVAPTIDDGYLVSLREARG